MTSIPDYNIVYHCAPFRLKSPNTIVFPAALLTPGLRSSLTDRGLEKTRHMLVSASDNLRPLPLGATAHGRSLFTVFSNTLPDAVQIALDSVAALPTQFRNLIGI